MQTITYPGLSQADRPMGPAPLSAAVLNGSFLFVSGQVGIDPMTRQVAGSDIASQTRQALTNIRTLVEAAGMSMSDIVKVGIFLVDPDDFAAMNEVYATFFAPPYPARATVGIRLNDPSLLIELDAIAMRHAS
jgi:2-iminobutanoate/2-iminopropanoate deaminase